MRNQIVPPVRGYPYDSRLPEIVDLDRRRRGARRNKRRTRRGGGGLDRLDSEIRQGESHHAERRGLRFRPRRQRDRSDRDAGS